MSIKRNIIILFLILGIGTFYMLGIDSVQADVAGGAAPVTPPVTPGGNHSGTATIQYKMYAYGYRISIVNSNGNALAPGTHSVDYWLTWPSPINESYYCKGKNFITPPMNNGTYIWACERDVKYYSTSLPKTLRPKNTSTSTTYPLTGNHIKFDTYLSSINTSSENVVDIAGVKIARADFVNPVNTNLHGNLIANALLNSFQEDMNDETLDANGEKNRNHIFAKFFLDAGVDGEGKTDTDVVNSVKDYYMIVEPLMAIGSTAVTQIYVGTISDIYMLGFIPSADSDPAQHSNSNLGWAYDRYNYMNPVVWNTKKRAGVDACNNSSANNFANRGNLSSSGCSGVFTVSIGEDIVKKIPCNNNKVKEVYNDYYKGGENAEEYNQKITAACGDDDCSHLLSSNLEKYGIKSVNDVSCSVSCSDTANRIYNNSIDNSASKPWKKFVDALQDLFPDNKLNSMPSDSIPYKYAKETFGVDYNGKNYCDHVSCQDVLNQIKNKPNYRTLLKKLSTIFKNYNLLNEDILQALYETDDNDEWLQKANCDSTPVCLVTSQTASCKPSDDSTNSFTLKDTDLSEDLEKTPSQRCLENGIAYNALQQDDNIVMKEMQSSKDSEYGKDGYCWESVSFNFPSSPKSIKAGNLLKWKIASINDSDFGNMTVTRTCYIDYSYYNESNKVITSKWADLENESIDGRINPIINIYYKEAIPISSDYKGIELNESAPLTVNLSDFSMTAYGGINNGNIVAVSEESDKDDNPRTFTCGEDCSTISHVTMTATYNLTYGKDFKWYSNKANSGKYESETNIEDVADAKYVYLGYGMPTSFITPTNLALKVGESYGYSLNNSEGKGYLYATVSQIGTKNKGTKGGYHFDKYVTFAIKDDATLADGTREDNYKDKIVYSCGFSIYNQLFGYEDGLCTENCNPTESPKGIDVVFRTVELVNNEDELSEAFPGRSGNGREIGYNWTQEYFVEHELSVDNISSILRSDVYSYQPMYHIDLTPEKISDIRKENKILRGAGFDPYTYMEDNTYSFYQSDIYKSDNTYVASNFLTNLKKKGWLDGVCLNHFGLDTFERSKYFASMAPGECSWQYENKK